MKKIFIVLVVFLYSCSDDELPSEGKVILAAPEIFNTITSTEYNKNDLLNKSEVYIVRIDEKKSADFAIITVPAKAFIRNDSIIIQTGMSTKFKGRFLDYNKYQLCIYNRKYKFAKKDGFIFPYLDKYIYEYYPLSINNFHPVKGDTLLVNATVKEVGIAKTGYDEVTYYRFEINTVIE